MGITLTRQCVHQEKEIGCAREGQRPKAKQRKMRWPKRGRKCNLLELIPGDYTAYLGLLSNNLILNFSVDKHEPFSIRLSISRTLPVTRMQNLGSISRWWLSPVIWAGKQSYILRTLVVMWLQWHLQITWESKSMAFALNVMQMWCPALCVHCSTGQRIRSFYGEMIGQAAEALDFVDSQSHTLWQGAWSDWRGDDDDDDDDDDVIRV